MLNNKFLTVALLICFCIGNLYAAECTEERPFKYKDEVFYFCNNKTNVKIKEILIRYLNQNVRLVAYNIGLKYVSYYLIGDEDSVREVLKEMGFQADTTKKYLNRYLDLEEKECSDYSAFADYRDDPFLAGFIELDSYLYSNCKDVNYQGIERYISYKLGISAFRIDRYKEAFPLFDIYNDFASDCIACKDKYEAIFHIIRQKREK